MQIPIEAVDSLAQRQLRRREARVRRALAKRDCALCKSRARNWSVDNQGEYRIVDPYTNAVVAGERFDWTLEAVEAWAFAEPAPQ